jgi:group I intron endonuclease
MSEIAYLYRIVNTLDGMAYIGVTKNPKVRFRGHAFHNTKTRSILKAAIKKYGVENFNMEVMLVSTQDYCYEMERKAIEAYGTRKPNGYNICAGGRGAVGLSGALNGMYGRTGEAHPHYGKPGYNIGRKLSEETKLNMSKARLGQKRSSESCEKMRQIALSRSPDLLQRMADARRAAILRKKTVTA